MPTTHFVRCYAPGVNPQSRDYIQMSLADARRMVSDGLAEVFRHKHIRMFARTLLKLRDRSCSWSHRLMELVGEGNYAACAMLGWLEEYRMAI